ncbi:MAG TPA: DUF6655 family protein [Verrucomicrobiae bacterium]|nr:DUF6655 family protein [Verrucomicrobiae bacterium]
MSQMGKDFFVTIVSAAAMLALSGCTQTGLTNPKRSATEQLLISTAADRALAQVDFSIVRGKKVYVDPSHYNSEDEDYVIGSIRDFVSINDGLLVPKLEEADLVLEPRNGALSIDASNSLIGMPASAAPLPIAGSVNLPEVAIYKSEKQFSIAKIALLAYERDSHKHVASTGPKIGRANIKYYKFLGLISYTKTTVPERKKLTKEQKIQQGGGK